MSVRYCIISLLYNADQRRAHKILGNTAKKDWQAIQKMYKSGVYLHVLFFAHLHLEKLCKALWVKNNEGNHPPKIHNLIRILNEAKIQYLSEHMDFMNIMNQFQLEGRYPDYLNKLYKAYKKKKCR